MASAALLSMPQLGRPSHQHMKKRKLERKSSFPGVRRNSSRDFRKEFKGSILDKRRKRTHEGSVSFASLENLTNIVRKYFGVWSTYFVPAADKECQPESPNSPFDAVPTEVLARIFCELDETTVKAARVVCRRWNEIAETEKQQRSATPFTVNRFVIRYIEQKKAYDMTWCVYKTRKSKSISVTHEEVKRRPQLAFSFRHFDIQQFGQRLTA
jgi:hypothetical protein